MAHHTMKLSSCYNIIFRNVIDITKCNTNYFSIIIIIMAHHTMKLSSRCASCSKSLAWVWLRVRESWWTLSKSRALSSCTSATCCWNCWFTTSSSCALQTCRHREGGTYGVYKKVDSIYEMQHVDILYTKNHYQ